MMRADEILQEYKQDRRSFQGVSLRGLFFRGKDLSGADVSGADIRGTNFREAILKGAKFQGARAGLQKRWVIVLLIGAFILAGFSGFLAFFNGYLISLIFASNPPENQIAAWVSLIIFVVFWIIIIRNGIGSDATAITIAIAGAIAGAFAGDIAIAGAITITIAEAIAGPGAGTQILLSAYIAYRAIKGDEKYALIRNILLPLLLYVEPLSEMQI